MAKSIDELMTSRSIVGRTDFPDYDMLDAMIASALNKLLERYMHFRKRVRVEEHRAQEDDRFLRGRQSAYMIYDHFQSTGAHDAAQGQSDLFKISLHEDYIQDFDTRWDQALLTASGLPTEDVVDGLYKMKKQDREMPRFQTLRTMERQHIDQTKRTRNFKAWNERIETGVFIG